MKNYKLLMTIAFIFLGILLSAQSYVVQINQPEILEADAGDNIVLSLGNSVSIGGDPSALYGNGDYLYEWSPATWLDDPFLANPVATPLDTITYTLTVFDLKNCIAVDEMTIFVTPASVPQYNFEDYFTILPNPNNGEFIINSKLDICLDYILIYDITGKLVYSEETKNTENLNRDIDISNQPAGQYLIKLTASDRVYSGKILIQ